MEVGRNMAAGCSLILKGGRYGRESVKAMV